MKKVYFFMVAILATSTVISQDNGDTLSFESFDLNSNDYFHGVEGVIDFSIGDIILSNSYTLESWGDNWEGFAVSKVQDNTTSGFENQYAAFTNGGANGSEKYGIYFSGYTPQKMEFTSKRTLKSIQVTNTTYTGLSMRDGYFAAKKFGSPNDANGNPDGTNGEDWFLLKIIPLDENDNLVGDTIEFYLADFRYTDDNDDYILDTWETISFPNDIVAKKITFELSSSDNGDWGMNTPSYFAFDNLVSEEYSLGIMDTKSATAMIYPNPATDKLTVVSNEKAEMELYNSLGQTMKTGTLNGTLSIDVSTLPAGVYRVSLKSNSGTSIQKIIIQ
jgi:hypothetical protein